MRFAMLSLAVMTAGCGGWSATDSTDGAEVFKAVCANCHGPEGKPDPGTVARIHPRDFTAAAFKERVTPALVENQVRKGSDNKLMPPFQGVLKDDQIKAVAAYVSQRFGN
jgi:mono/diheme cytochrome c family protein